MAQKLSFPRLSLRRVAIFAMLSALGGATLAAGCGNSGTGDTGSGGHFTMTSTSNGNSQGGMGGTLFGTSTTSGSSMSTGSDTTTGGPAPGMPCQSGSTSMGMLQWAHNYGDSNGQYGLAVATDPSGNVLVVGQYSGTLTIGSATLTTTDKGVFVAKLAPDGTAMWAKGFAAAKSPGANALPTTTGRAVVTDSSGNVFVAGDFTGTISFGGSTSPLVSAGGFFGDMFLIKMDPTGNVLNANRIGDPSSTPSSGGSTQTSHALALRKTPTGDQVVLVGDAEGILDIGGGKTYPGGTNAASAFVAVFFATDLSPHFGALFGDGTVAQSIHSVAYDQNSDILITGNTVGAITFPGGMMLTAAGKQDAFVAKIKGDGSGTTWAKLYGSANGTAGGEGLATDATGNVFVTGDFQGTIDFGGGAIDNPYGANVFAAKLDGSGAHVWSKGYGDSMAQHAHGIAVDAMGRAIIMGQYSGTIQIGGGLLTSAGGDDIFVARLDTKGCQVWAKSFGDPGLQAAKGVAVDASGNAIITGQIGGTVDFGGGALTAAGDDLFVAKFAP